MQINNSSDIRRLDISEIHSVNGAGAVSSGITGAFNGGGVGGALGSGGALMAGIKGARWGMIGGIGGAVLGAAIGVGFYYMNQ